MASSQTKSSGAPTPGNEAELESGRMPFMAHLRELRDRVRDAAIAFVVCAFASWFVAKDIFEWLRAPLFDAWKENPKRGDPFTVFTSVTDPFFGYMSVAIWTGIFAASPFIFYQLWKFIAPGLYKHERRMGIAFALVSAVFFVSGAVFCYYFVMPPMFSFLLGYVDDTNKAMLVMGEYLEQTRNTMLAFGAVFELPLLIYVLAKVGLVTHRGLWRFNRWFVVIAFVVGAILTPSPDVVSQLAMALPMIVLYNVSILAAYRVTKKREKAQGIAAAADDDE